jgi:hypothetical protein
MLPLSSEARTIVCGGTYKHYKDKRYEVIAVARHSESFEELVVYRALYGDQGVWVRPLKMFTESVKVNGLVIPRFELVLESDR